MLKFPSDIDQSADVFLMYPVGFSVESTQRGVRKTASLNTAGAVSLPTPSEGISLNESGNWEETTGYQNFQGTVTANLGKAALDGLGDTGKVAFGKGKFVNDYASLSYGGSNFRTYTFTWDLIPDSLEEAQSISSIIKHIRTHSLPQYDGPVLNYPSMWKVYPAMRTQIGLFLKDCVITNFTVNYTPDGVLRRYKSGHPLSVNMQIEFKELYRAERGDV